MEYIAIVFVGLLGSLYVVCSIAELMLTIIDRISQRRRLQSPGILIVANHSRYLRILARWFVDDGFNVWATADRKEAAQLLKTNKKRVDLVLLDADHQGEDCSETLASIRQQSPFLPCCFMVAQLNDSYGNYLSYLGAAAAFDKPLELRESTAVIREIIKKNPVEYSKT